MYFTVDNTRDGINTDKAFVLKIKRHIVIADESAESESLVWHYLISISDAD